MHGWFTISRDCPSKVYMRLMIFSLAQINMHLFIHDILAARDIEKPKIYDVVKVAKMINHSH